MGDRVVGVGFLGNATLCGRLVAWSLGRLVALRADTIVGGWEGPLFRNLVRAFMFVAKVI